MTKAEMEELAARAESNGLAAAKRTFTDTIFFDRESLSLAADFFTVAASLRARASLCRGSEG